MRGKIIRSVMGLIAIAMALAFFAPPIVKLRDPAMIIVILIGVAAMVYSFVEFVREEDED